MKEAAGEGVLLPLSDNNCSSRLLAVSFELALLTGGDTGGDTNTGGDTAVGITVIVTA